MCQKPGLKRYTQGKSHPAAVPVRGIALCIYRHGHIEQYPQGAVPGSPLNVCMGTHSAEGRYCKQGWLLPGLYFY